MIEEILHLLLNLLDDNANENEGNDLDLDKWKLSIQLVPKHAKEYETPKCTEKKKCGSEKCHTKKFISNDEIQRQYRCFLECKETRASFNNYIDSLGKDLFMEICESFPEGSVELLDRHIYDNNTDPQMQREAISRFYKEANKVIMDKIVKLKSLMRDF